jgi:asparagine synthase (glutamine-hydrolysing)
MLLMGHLWGDHTLVEEVAAVRPATVLEVVDGERSSERYWKPDFTEEEPGPAYISELVRRYRQAAGRAAGTLPSEAGIWLSGGLDSRTTASALLEHAGTGEFDTLRAYTYNANPPTSDNTRIAGDIAQRLGIELKQIPLTAESVDANFDRIVEATDGMVRWVSTLNLSATYATDRVSPVMMEGMQGALVGDHLLRHHLDGSHTPVEAQYDSEAGNSAAAVRRVLASDVDPFATFKEEVEYSDERGSREQVLDIHFQNYYSRHAMSSNRLMRDRGGSRVPHSDGDYVEWCAKLPLKYRKGTTTLPVGNQGRIPLGTSPVKLKLSQRLSPDLADITYERTKMKPKYPYPAHVGGFFANVIFNRLRSKPTYGNGQLADFWIRDRTTDLHDRIAGLVADARSRDIFDGDGVQAVFDEHMDGANNAPMLSQITTLEHWIQNHLD